MRCAEAAFRSISACAEETVNRDGDCHNFGVDLRVRGGDTYALTGITCTSGRSPRARRRRHQTEGGWIGERSISACAEET